MKIKKYLKNALVVITGALLFVSCNDSSNLGLGIIPGTGDYTLGQIDSFYGISNTYKEDTVRTVNAQLQLLGNIWDPIFGETKAGFTSQVDLPTQNVNFGSNLSLDSLVLVLRLNNYYGDTTTKLRFKVFELNETLYKDTSYTQFYKPNLLPTPLADVVLTINPKDSVWVSELGNVSQDSLRKLPPQIRIKLNSQLGQRILSASGTTSLATNADFKGFFKGLYVEATQLNAQDRGCLYTVHMNSEYSGMHFYYHSDTVRKKYTFPTSLTSIKVNQFDHNYTNSRVGTALGQANNPNGEMYIQGLAGVKSTLHFPWLDSIIGTKKYIINKAEIVFNIAPGTGIEPFPAANSLLLLTQDSLGKSKPIIDQIEPWYDGVLNKTTNKYKFKITRHLQEMINGTIKDTKFVLITNGSLIAAHRTILSSPTHLLYPPKLIITFTKLNP